MKIEISNGELLDKLSILELKLKKITDENKLINVRSEFEELSPLAQQIFNKKVVGVNNLYLKLSEVFISTAVETNLYLPALTFELCLSPCSIKNVRVTNTLSWRAISVNPPALAITSTIFMASTSGGKT